MAQGASEQHQCAWIAIPLSFEEEERALSLLRAFREAVLQAEDCCGHLQETAGFKMTRTAYGLEEATEWLTRLPEMPVSLADHLLQPCQSAATRAKLATFVAHAESFRQASERLSSFTNDVRSLLSPEISQELGKAQESLRQWGLEELSVSDLRQLFELATEGVKDLVQARSAFQTPLGVDDDPP